jgi:hypothetical protein
MNQPPPEGSMPPPGAGDGSMGVPYSAAAATPAVPLPAQAQHEVGFDRNTPALPQKRSSDITVIGVLFLIGAALAAIGLLGALTDSGSGDSGSGGFATFFGLLVGVGYVAANAYAGTLILQRDIRGRGLGLVLLGLGLLFCLVAMVSNPAYVISAVIPAAMFRVLWKTDELVRR